jgi:hypothetical protein
VCALGNRILLSGRRSCGGCLVNGGGGSTARGGIGEGELVGDEAEDERGGDNVAVGGLGAREAEAEGEAGPPLGGGGDGVGRGGGMLGRRARQSPSPHR